MSDAEEPVREDLGRPTRSTTASSTSTFTSSTRSPRRRPSRGCGSRAARVRRPDKTLATADHNVPTDGTAAARLIADELSRVQVETLERNCEEFGVPIYSLGSDRQGIVHVIGPELGVTQPGMTIVCGDSHTSTHGAFGALAIGIGTSEVEHVLATQCLVQRRPKAMRIHYAGELGRGVTAKDLILATIGRLGVGGMAGHAVEYAGPAIEALLDGEPDDDLQHDYRGRRAGRDDRARRDDLCLHGGPSRARREDFSDAVARWRELPTEDGASFDTEVEIDASSLSPMVTWGTTPGMVVEVTDSVPDPSRLDSPADREAAERALAYMALEPGTPMSDIPPRPRLHRLVHELEDRGPARAAAVDPRVRRQGQRRLEAMVVPGSQQVKTQAESEGLHEVFESAGFEWRSAGCSMCLGMNPDILEPGERCASTSNRNFEGRQGRGGRTHLVSAADGGGRRRRGPLRGHQGVVAERAPSRHHRGRTSRCSTAPTSTPTRSSPSSSSSASSARASASFSSTTGSAAARSSSSPTRSSSPGATSARGRAASTRPGRFRTSASRRSSRPPSRTSSTATAPRSGSCR